jgi:hypothetical protein
MPEFPGSISTPGKYTGRIAILAGIYKFNGFVKTVGMNDTEDRPEYFSVIDFIFGIGQFNYRGPDEITGS